jgi:PiT family inorganic phosphate transporter
MLHSINVSLIAYVLLFASALFAWNMGSHYSGAVMGMAYGSKTLSIRQATGIAAIFAVLGTMTASSGVVHTYAFSIVGTATTVQLAAALLGASVAIFISTVLKLPASTIQVYTFSLVFVGIVSHVNIMYTGLVIVLLMWILIPLVAMLLSYLLAPKIASRFKGEGRKLKFIIIGSSIFSSFTLGSNDVSNAISSVVKAGILTGIDPYIFGGVFIALGLITWGQRLIRRIGTEIVKTDPPLAATAQLTQAIAILSGNLIGYNASINQTLITSLYGAKRSTKSEVVTPQIFRSIALNWITSSLIAAVFSLLFIFIFSL